jgi:hypothetical protein
MSSVELLQHVGLNKYEATAYYALLAHGPLTGYELGKRSEIPLSRSYEILERLVARGLALVQPGDPPRYAPADAAAFLAGIRHTLHTTLDALATDLLSLQGAATAGEFWVVRGTARILDHARGMIDAAHGEVALALDPPLAADLAPALDAARARGCLVAHTMPLPTADGPAIVVLAGAAALLGTLAPRNAQAVTGSNPVLLAAVRIVLAQVGTAIPAPRAAAPAPAAPTSDWLAWEEEKQRRLVHLHSPN